MKQFIKVMKALSDPNRVKIVKIPQSRPLCVCEIKETLGIAQSTASKHLKLLEDAGLVRSFKEGLWVNYSLADGSDSPYCTSMIGNLKHWLENEKTNNDWLPGQDTIQGETIFQRPKRAGFLTGYFYSKKKLGFLINKDIDVHGLSRNFAVDRATDFFQSPGTAYHHDQGQEKVSDHHHQ